MIYKNDMTLQRPAALQSGTPDAASRAAWEEGKKKYDAQYGARDAQAAANAPQWQGAVPPGQMPMQGVAGQRPAAQAQSVQAPQPQTFAAMRNAGMARPPQPSSVTPQLRSAVAGGIANPSAYGAPEAQATFQRLNAALSEKFGLQRRAVDEQMARRGLFDSTTAVGALGDVAIQQSRAQADLAGQIAEQQALRAQSDRASAIGQGMQLAGMDQSAQQFDLQQRLAELLGLGGLDLQRGAQAEGARQFDASRQQQDRQFDATQGLQREQLVQQGGQFDKSQQLTRDQMLQQLAMFFGLPTGFGIDAMGAPMDAPSINTPAGYGMDDGSTFSYGDPYAMPRGVRMSGLNGFLAALSGGLTGLGTGLEYNRQRKASEDEAQARRRSEALQATLQKLQAQQQYGLVPKAQATNGLRDMLSSLGGADAGSVTGGIGMALAPLAGAIDRRSTTSLPNADGGMDEYTIDPTQSAAGRATTAARAEADRVYSRDRTAAYGDQERVMANKRAEADATNQREFATFKAAFPTHALASTYNPAIDYGAITQRTDALDRQDRGFTQQRALQDRSFGQQTAMQDRLFGQQTTLAKTKADADPSVKASDGERTAASFLPRLLASEQQLSSFTDKDIPNALTVAAGRTLPGAMSTNSFRMWDQARTNFVAALLRRESGASISPGEYADADRIYIPLPGDGPDVLARKAASRKDALRQMQISAGRAVSLGMPQGVSGDTNATVPANPFR